MHDPAYVEETIARGRTKLEALRGGRVVARPAGRFWGRVIGGGILLLIGLAFLAGLVALLADADWDIEDDRIRLIGLGPFLVLLGLLFAVPGLLLTLRSKARSPKDAVTLFFRSVARGSAAGARRIVVPNDFDDLPRFYPEQRALGLGGASPYEFGEREGFKQYWNGLLRYHSAPYCIARFKNVRTEEVAPDVAIVEFDMTVMLNTQLWFLFILLGCIGIIVAIIVDAATRKRVTVHMRKIVYRVGDEWHLLNGEWQGPEEEDVSWLGA